MEELTQAFEKIQKGEDPNDEENLSDGNAGVNGSKEDAGSDSCPSEDNLELR